MLDLSDENFGMAIDPKIQMINNCLPKQNINEFNFKYANVKNPANFTNTLKQSQPHASKIMDMRKGTTTLAFRIAEGIMIAVDSRASMGNMNASEICQKVIEINPYLLGTLAGGAADCQYWEPYIANRARLYQLQNNGEMLSVAACSKMLSNIMFAYRGHGLSMGIMFAGVDHLGPHLYYMDDHGNRLEGNRFSVGSGSTYCYGVLDSYYRWDMTKEEAIWLGKRAVSEATHQDSASGGGTRLYWFGKDSRTWEKIEHWADNSELNWAEMNKKGLNNLNKIKEMFA